MQRNSVKNAEHQSDTTDGRTRYYESWQLIVQQVYAIITWKMQKTVAILGKMKKFTGSYCSNNRSKRSTYCSRNDLDGLNENRTLIESPSNQLASRQEVARLQKATPLRLDSERAR